MSINNSPLKLSSKNLSENYISYTSPNDEQRYNLSNCNYFSSFPSYPNTQEQNINNIYSSEKEDNSFQNIISNQNNYYSNDLINSFKNINNYKNENNNISNNNNENNLLNELRKQYDERIISLHNNIKLVISKIENDDVLASMRDDMDNANSPFIANRIKEINR